MEIEGLEPSTYGLQSRRSSQLSYIPRLVSRTDIKKEWDRKKYWESVLSRDAPSITALYMIVYRGVKLASHGRYPSHRKEVIQPHLPVRLPCYDFTLLTKRTFDVVPLTVGQTASGTPHSDGVTGGVYKARERIHRAMLMRDY